MTKEFRCLVDGEDDIHTTCVIDKGKLTACVHGKSFQQKEDCPFWQVFPKKTKTKTYYYVIRTWCHTDKKQLWQVMSRRIIGRPSAEIALDYARSLSKNPKHQFFLVRREE